MVFLHSSGLPYTIPECPAPYFRRQCFINKHLLNVLHGPISHSLGTRCFEEKIGQRTDHCHTVISGVTKGTQMTVGALQRNLTQERKALVSGWMGTWVNG